MEARRIYLKVALLLRGNSIDEKYKYPHSIITENLKLNVLESEFLLQVQLTHYLAYASLYSHDKADIQMGIKDVSKLFTKALTSIPYLKPTVSKSIDEERADAIRKWKEMVRQHLEEMKNNGNKHS